MSIKTHTFNGRQYRVREFRGSIEGVTDVPGSDDHLEMLVMDGDDIHSLHSAYHKSLHALGIPDKYVHDKNGDYSTWDGARFLWRLGWRKVK